MAIPTNGIQLVRISGAVFNQQLSASDYSEILAANKTAAELDAWANAAVAAEFKGKTTTDIAKAVLANVGLSTVSGLEAWVAGQLNAGGGFAKAGATLLTLLNDYSNMSTADATYGASVKTFNTKVANSQTASQTAGTASGTYAAVSSVSAAEAAAAAAAAAQAALTTASDTAAAAAAKAIADATAADAAVTAAKTALTAATAKAALTDATVLTATTKTLTDAVTAATTAKTAADKAVVDATTAYTAALNAANPVAADVVNANATLLINTNKAAVAAKALADATAAAALAKTASDAATADDVAAVAAQAALSTAAAASVKAAAAAVTAATASKSAAAATTATTDDTTAAAASTAAAATGADGAKVIADAAAAAAAEKAAADAAAAKTAADAAAAKVIADAAAAKVIADAAAAKAAADALALTLAPKTFTLTTSIDSGTTFTGGAGNDVFNATGTTFTAGDVIDGGAGTADKLSIIDVTGVLNAARVDATVTNVEIMEIATAGRLGQAASTGTKQVNTFVMPASVANVQQVNEYVFSTAAGVAAQPVTIGGALTSYQSSTTAATQAAAFLAAANATVGSTVAYIGGTVAVNDAADSVNNVFTYDTLSAAGILKVGMSVTGTSIPAGTTIASFTATTITLSAPVTTGLADNATITIGGGVAGVSIYSPTSGVTSPAVSFGAVGSAGSVPTAALITGNTAGNVGQTVSFTYNGLPGSYAIGADATTTGGNFVTALNAVAGYTAAVNTTGSVAVTAATAGTALPTIAFTGATGNIPSGTTTTANGSAATSQATYRVDGIALDSFKATATTVIDVRAKATTALDLVGTGAVTVAGGGNDSSFTSAGGAVAIGGTTTIANGYSSIAVKGNSTTVDITDNSGLAVDGLTVAVGSKLTTVAITANSGLATLTGKGITDVSLSSSSANNSSGGLTVTNSTAHPLSLKLAGVTAGTVTDGEATSVTVTSNAAALAATTNTLTGLTTNKAVGLTVTGTKAVNLGTIAAAKLQTLTVTGSGGVTADVANDGDTTNNGYVTSVNTTGSTATLSAANGTTGNNITIGVSTDFAGGAGVDNLTVGASTRALSLGAGNDKLVLTAALAGTATTGGTADGGDGTDTLEMDFAQAVTAGSSSGLTNTKITGFERFSITAGTFTTDVTVDFDYLGKINSYVKLGAFTGASADVLTLANLADSSTIELTGAFGSNALLAASIKNAATSTTNVLNLKLVSNDTLLAAGSVTSNDIETVNIETSNTVTATLPATRTDTLTLAANAVKTIVISGNAGLNLTNTNTTITSINASGITGTTAAPNGFTYASGALTNTAKTVTVTGTAAGVNAIDLDSITDTLMVSTITVGGSANVSANTFVGGAGVDNVTGGSGTDSFTMKEGRDVITTGAGSDKIAFATTAVDRDTVTDFTVGAGSAGDKIISANFTSAEYAVFTTRTAAYTLTGANTTGHTLEFAIEGNSTVNLNDNSANSLTGVNLLKALNDGVTEATITLTTITDADVQYVVGYQGGKAYIYNVASGGTGATIVGSELALVGILDNVALGALTADNFIAS